MLQELVNIILVGLFIICMLYVLVPLRILVREKDMIEKEEKFKIKLEQLGFKQISMNMFERKNKKGITTLSIYHDSFNIYPGVVDRELLKVLYRYYR